jgi:chromosome partitioning protein
MIVTIGGVKGGTGKTTIATNLIISLARHGEDPLLIDGDEQKTSLHFSALRNENTNGNAGYSCVRVTGGEQIKAEASRMAKKFSTVIIDVGGWDNVTQRGAILASDIVLFPFQPRTFDAWTLGRVQNLVIEARIYNPQLKAFTVLSRADTRGSDNEETAAYLIEAEELTYLSSSICNRKAYSNAAKSGKGVVELRKEDPKAAAEIDALQKDLFSNYKLLRGTLRC